MTRPEQDITRRPDLLHGVPRAGPVRERRPVYVDLLPPATPAAGPGRTSRPGWRTWTPAVTSRSGASWLRTIRSRRSTGGSVTTRARPSATAPTSTARFRSTRSSVSSAISHWRGGGCSTRHRSAAVLLRADVAPVDRHGGPVLQKLGLELLGALAIAGVAGGDLCAARRQPAADGGADAASAAGHERHAAGEHLDLGPVRAGVRGRGCAGHGALLSSSQRSERSPSQAARSGQISLFAFEPATRAMWPPGRAKWSTCWRTRSCSSSVRPTARSCRATSVRPAMRRLRTTRSPAWKPIPDRATTFSVARASSSPNASPATSCSAAVVGCGGRVHVPSRGRPRRLSWPTSEVYA
jgi:hypothetical protein